MSDISTLVMAALRKRGAGPRVVYVGLHRDDVARLRHEMDAQRQPGTYDLVDRQLHFAGYEVREDALAPQAIPLVRNLG